MFKKKALIGGLLGGVLLASSALAAGFFTNGLPPAGGTQYPGTLPLTGLETLPADTNLLSGANPASESISTGQLEQLGNASPDNTNFLVGGDAGTNLWQRGTTGASQTTTVAYGGPDRWAYWSGTGTAMTVSRDTTASDLSTAYQAAFKMARTSGQTGVLPVCMAQEVTTQNSYALAGQTVELDFHAYTGANFSGANANMTAYVVYGTGSDEGMAKLAFGLNGGGGGSSGWTGQANASAAVVNLGAISTAGRYAVVASIPATATEVGVALCWTPVGTAGTNDYLAFEGIQLKRSSLLSAYVSTTVGYTASTIGASSFQRRPASVEQMLQQAYYYQVTESASIFPVAPCAAVDTTHTNCIIRLPTTMRAAPTLTFANGFATPTSTTQATLGACTTLSAATTVASTVGGVDAILVNCAATTVPAAGVASFLYSNGGTGTIKASAEL